MVSVMEIETKGEICDSHPNLTHSAVSQRSIDIDLTVKDDEADLVKKTLKLDLTPAILRTDKVVGVAGGTDGNKVNPEIKSPISPSGKNGSRMVHQTSLTSQVEVVDDRKALRDALYQGIFHRHRRTIFAVGSFLRMLRTRNSQYNTIRSSSEGDEEPR